METSIAVNADTVLLAVGALALVFFGAFGLGYEYASCKFYRYLAACQKDADDILHGERNNKNVKGNGRNKTESAGA